MVLQRLVRQVDAELLETVDLEVLKPKNIQKANPIAARHLMIEHRVALVDEPLEGLVVQPLHQRLLGVCRGRRIEDFDDDLPRNVERCREELLFERLMGDSEQSDSLAHRRRAAAGDDGALALGAEFDISEVEDSRHDRP